VEHRKADTLSVAGCGASVDDAALFLRELRQLRSGAGLGHAELAARAHYPYDSIRAAEVGPSLPDLPVLCAYVRGCGGTAEEWEERWRSLTRTPSLPVPAARHAGQSAAASAGARISAAAAPATDAPDPSVIMAALDRVAEGMAGAGTGPAPAETVVQRTEPAAETPAPEPQPTPAPQPSPASAAPAAETTTGWPPSPASAPPTAETTGWPGTVHDDKPAEWPGTDDKPAGWDPIRVSSAWPALRNTPPAAAPSPGSADFGTAVGAGTPWGSASGEEDFAGSVTRAGAGRPGPAAGTGGPASGAAAAKAAPAPAVAGQGWPSSPTRVAVLAGVVVCVLAVLLAVFL
jgi:Helix-turn-helix domain